MPRTLIIAEKPSVASDIARVLGATKRTARTRENDRFIITWCFGHLAGLAPPSAYGDQYAEWSLEALPILPDRFQLECTGDRAQLDHLRKLLTSKDVSTVVNACDAAREGEAIFRNVYEWAGADLPVYRLWIASMTDGAIEAGFRNLKPGAAYENLAAAARCRAQADWVVGLNATRALTVRARAEGSDTLLSVGRVQTPVLALIVDRDHAIARFESTPFWKLELTAGDEPATFTALAVDHDHQQLRWGVKAEVDAVYASLASHKTVTVLAAEEETRSTRAPLLFDLTALQREANVRLGFSAKRTLELAQALYETHKVLTYPRTDSGYITADLEETLSTRLNAAADVLPEEVLSAGLQRSVGAHVINDAKVADHHAILPTETVVANVNLSVDERSLYELVARRLLAAHLPPCLKSHGSVQLQLGGQTFLAQGTRTTQEGWRQAEPPAKPSKDTKLPAVEVGAQLKVQQLRQVESQTRPPKQFTEASLLAAMESAGQELEDSDARQAMKDSGLGTPATRADTIEKLITRGYVARDGKKLVSTLVGQELIAILPEPTLKSAELTGRWEKGLRLVQDGQVPAETFMAKVYALTTSTVEAIASCSMKIEHSKQEVLGTCPVCAADVVESSKAFGCTTGEPCSFVIWKMVAGKRITASTASTLLKRGHTKLLRGFKSRAGKRFSAHLYLDAQAKVKLCFDAEELQAAGYPK